MERPIHVGWKYDNFGVKFATSLYLLIGVQGYHVTFKYFLEPSVSEVSVVRLRIGVAFLCKLFLLSYNCRENHLEQGCPPCFCPPVSQ